MVEPAQLTLQTLEAQVIDLQANATSTQNRPFLLASYLPLLSTYGACPIRSGQKVRVILLSDILPRQSVNEPSPSTKSPPALTSTLAPKRALADAKYTQGVGNIGWCDSPITLVFKVQ